MPNRAITKVLTASITVGVLLTGCSSGSGPNSITGRITFTAAGGNAEACTILRDNTTVFLRDGSGTVLDTQVLPDNGYKDGTTAPGGCTYDLNLSGKSSDGQYEISIGQDPGSGIFYSTSDLESNNWTVDISGN